MKHKKLETLDPEYKPLYYYTSGSYYKPLSINQKCKNAKNITGYKARFSKIMYIFAIAYAIFLLYLMLYKPKFAVDYNIDKQRQTVLQIPKIYITGSIVPLWLEDKILLSLALKYDDIEKQDLLQINTVNYTLIAENYITKKNITDEFLKQTTLQKNKQKQELFFSIPLIKEPLPSSVEVELITSKEKKTLTLLIQS